MESRTKLFGHPIHPMLIVLPLGLLIMSVVFDVLHIITGNATFSTVAYYDIAAGIIGGLLAALIGLLDWLSIPQSTRAKSIGAMHGIGNVVVVALFAVSWLIRNGNSGHQPSTLAFVISLLAIALGAVTAWLGGELVYRLRMAVDDGANLNAPSSLSGEPAGPVTDTRRK
jgi:uncharacterized membrane protein